MRSSFLAVQSGCAACVPDAGKERLCRLVCQEAWQRSDAGRHAF